MVVGETQTNVFADTMVIAVSCKTIEPPRPLPYMAS